MPTNLAPAARLELPLGTLPRVAEFDVHSVPSAPLPPTRINPVLSLRDITLAPKTVTLLPPVAPAFARIALLLPIGAS